MNNKKKLLIAAITLLALSCKHTIPVENTVTVSPEAGTTYKSGDVVTVTAHYSSNSKPDSIVYLLDSVKVGLSKDSSALSLKTDTMLLGPRVITAKVYQDGKSQEGSTNIVLLAAKTPEQYTYKVIKRFPHDTSSYTEGLLYQDGFLYESTGTEGHSVLRKVDLQTGKTIQMAKIDPKYFGEGSAIIGDKIIMLTYKNPRVLFVFDKNTFKLEKTLPYNVGFEGWGLCFDGKKLYTDDSTNRVWFLDKNDYHPTGYIDVYDDKAAINEINELEYIDGKLYANVYETDYIVVIDPKTGAVLQKINMQNIWPVKDRPDGFDEDNNVLNGIAYDAAGKRIFVTGKKWPYLYQVEFVKK